MGAKMLTLDQIKRKLEDRRLRVVAAATDISVGTLYNIMSDENPNPTHRVLQALSDYLDANP